MAAAVIALALLVGCAVAGLGWRASRSEPERRERVRAGRLRRLERSSQEHRSATVPLPPTHDDGRRPRRPRGPRGRVQAPGWGLGAGAACLVLFLLVGVVPVWQWLVAYAGPERATPWSLLARLVGLAVTGTLLGVWVLAQVRGRPPGPHRAGVSEPRDPTGPAAPNGRP